MMIKGRVWKFGNNIDTDLIAPGKYLDLEFDEFLSHILEPINPKFANNVKEGDLIVAGENFGLGSSREQAPRGLKGLGISCIVAESFARIFYRNCISIGLPALTSKNVSKEFRDGDEGEVDVKSGRIKNLTTGKVLQANPLPKSMLEILEAGGILELLKKSQNMV
ncbi:MAG: 3-isopropylmalate dehydratase small subunit [Candidatus Methanofastidiosia archaeon]